MYKLNRGQICQYTYGTPPSDDDLWELEFVLLETREQYTEVSTSLLLPHLLAMTEWCEPQESLQVRFEWLLTTWKGQGQHDRQEERAKESSL